MVSETWDLGEDCLNHAAYIPGFGRCLDVGATVVRNLRRGAGLEGVRQGRGDEFSCD